MGGWIYLPVKNGRTSYLRNGHCCTLNTVIVFNRSLAIVIPFGDTVLTHIHRTWFNRANVLRPLPQLGLSLLCSTSMIKVLNNYNFETTICILIYPLCTTAMNSVSFLKHTNQNVSMAFVSSTAIYLFITEHIWWSDSHKNLVHDI